MSRQDFTETNEDNSTETNVSSEDYSNEDNHEIEEVENSDDFSDENDYEEMELDDYQMDLGEEESEMLTNEIEVNMGEFFNCLNNFQEIVNNI